MDPKISEALELVRKACDSVMCDGPSRRAIEAALSEIAEALIQAPKK